MSVYWLIFLLACVVCGAVPFVARWEDRRDQADRDFYAKQFGGQR